MLKIIGSAIVIAALCLGCATKEPKPDPKDTQPAFVEDAGSHEDVWVAED